MRFFGFFVVSCRSIYQYYQMIAPNELYLFLPVILPVIGLPLNLYHLIYNTVLDSTPSYCQCCTTIEIEQQEKLLTLWLTTDYTLA